MLKQPPCDRAPRDEENEHQHALGAIQAKRDTSGIVETVFFVDISAPRYRWYVMLGLVSLGFRRSIAFRKYRLILLSRTTAMRFLCLAEMRSICHNSVFSRLSGPHNDRPDCSRAVKSGNPSNILRECSEPVSYYGCSFLVPLLARPPSFFLFSHCARG